jgi:GH15 family glucan-1,4-alpha-glucosidase
MALRLEDYALIGDTHTTALVGADGSIDWLCLPRIDSDACFAALLGTAEHGRWSLSPTGTSRPLRRAYRADTLVLDTELAGDGGVVRVVDCMPIREDDHPQVVRMVEGVSGRVRVRSEVALRFDYGHIRPWLRDDERRVLASAGPDTVVIDGDAEHRVDGDRCVAEFTVAAGQRVGLRLSWTGWEQRRPEAVDAAAVVAATERWWWDWVGRCRYEGDYRDAVVRSLITLKALTYAPSGGIAAAATTSLPERPGGDRNWDYRYCWLRDATFTLMALLDAGYEEEAAGWREWLLRVVAGQPDQMQILYRVDGARRVTEVELPWLPGYAGSTPVRIGNAAAEQFQLDVYGEVIDALHQARTHGIPPDPEAWQLQRALLDVLESRWREPDRGLWEVRGPRRQFTHSNVMAWVGVDRAIRAVESLGLDGPLDRWKSLRRAISDDIHAHGYHPERRAFTQCYGSTDLDAALLLIPALGFLPATEARMRNTVAAIEEDLCHNGLVYRYRCGSGEGAFLACSFWLADNYILQDRVEEGRALFERLLGLTNDVGLLAEEYDPHSERWVGNLPQAFSHVALINTAHNLAQPHGPTHRRAGHAAQ